MSADSRTVIDNQSSGRRSDATTWRSGWPVGTAAFALGSFVAVYGAYGDPNPKASQEHAVPAIVGLLAVVGVVVYGLIVPRLVPSQDRPQGRPRAAAVLGVIAFASLAAFWSGLPVVLGGAAVLIARMFRSRALGSRAVTATLVLGTLALGLDAIIAVVGNLG